MKKVLAITGIRSEYYILKPIIQALERSDYFKVSLVVSGAHLSQWHNYTINEIERDNFEIVDRIDSLFMTNRRTQRVKGIGCLLHGLSQTVEREEPDFLLVVGDREEAIATALVGNYMEVLVAHIGGGETVFGNADDPVRFAVSKLAHIHFTTAEVYSNILKQIGEEEFRIFNIGNPALDLIKQVPELNWDALVNKLGLLELKPYNYIMFIKHPLSSEKEQAYLQMKISLTALKKFAQDHNIKIIGIYPNTDPGAYDMLRAIEEFANDPLISYYKMLPQDIFVNLLRKCLCLVGNSSMGILESPFYHIPVVNIGRRQQGRINAGNVEFVDYQESEIYSALKKACFDLEYRKLVARLHNPFGDGTASSSVVNILKQIDPKSKRWLVKKNWYGLKL